MWRKQKKLLAEETRRGYPGEENFAIEHASDETLAVTEEKKENVAVAEVQAGGVV